VLNPNTLFDLRVFSGSRRTKPEQGRSDENVLPGHRTGSRTKRAAVLAGPHGTAAHSGYPPCFTSTTQPLLFRNVLFRSDLGGFSRLEIVLPFLALMRSREANGVLSDAALRSLQAFLGKRLIGELHARPFPRRMLVP